MAVAGIRYGIHIRIMYYRAIVWLQTFAKGGYRSRGA
jgi:hypothetical protein